MTLEKDHGAGSQPALQEACPAPTPSPLAPLAHRLLVPSNFCRSVNTTVRAGMLRPMANVSVVNSTWGSAGKEEEEGGNVHV